MGPFPLPLVEGQVSTTLYASVPMLFPIEGIKTTEVLGTLLGSLCVAINLKTKGKGIASRTSFPGVSCKNKRTKEQTNNQEICFVVNNFG